MDLNEAIWGKTRHKRQPVGRSQKSAVKISQKGKCYDCGKSLVIEEYHHIKPVSSGGKSTTKNLVALCRDCHAKRHILEKARKLDTKRKKTKKSTNFLGIPSSIRY